MLLCVLPSSESSSEWERPCAPRGLETAARCAQGTRVRPWLLWASTGDALWEPACPPLLLGSLGGAAWWRVR